MNRLIISAAIVESGALRFTPANLPALDLQLEHESEVDEAGQSRQVRATLKSVAFGAVAERASRQPIGTALRFSGFLATPRNGRHPVFHIQDFGPEPD